MPEFPLRQLFLTAAILLSSGAVQDAAVAASSARILGVAWTSLADLQELDGEGSTLRHVAPGVAILAVDGIDGIFIGPADLAVSMGMIGELNNLVQRRSGN